MKTTHLPSDPSAASAQTASDAGTLNTQPLPNNWMPRPLKDELLGLIFLPRMLEKGRQVLEGGRQGRDLMNGYLFGDFDALDRGLLKFLRTKDARVLALLRASDADAVVAGTLIRESGRTAAEIRAWNKRFLLLNAPFLAMIDADEGRREPGLGTSLLRLFYNYVLMPPVYLFFRIATALTSNSRDKHS